MQILENNYRCARLGRVLHCYRFGLCSLVGCSLRGHRPGMLRIDIFAEGDVLHTGPGAPLVHGVPVFLKGTTVRVGNVCCECCSRRSRRRRRRRSWVMAVGSCGSVQ